MTSAADLHACRSMMRGGSKSFFAAALVLPRRVRAPATALYAFCRVADDAIDLSDDPAEALDGLRQRLDAIYAGSPHAIAADRALTGVIERFAIPRGLLDALIEGFAWDAEGRRYDTIEAVHDYAARVAGAVGAMMALVMETREPRALARACELGVAMQLTNIARDVGEDARAGRLYLPRQWLHDAGIDPDAWLAAPAFCARMASVVARLLAEADRLYARGECGVAALPRDCRPAIQAARLVYAEIGRAIEAARHDAVRQRAVVRHRRKLALMVRACAAAIIAPGHPMTACASSEPLPAVRYLVAAAACADLPRRTFYQRTLRMLDLFERLEQRQRQPMQLHSA
jgi:15-cis-phytoene synthase